MFILLNIYLLCYVRLSSDFLSCWYTCPQHTSLRDQPFCVFSFFDRYKDWTCFVYLSKKIEWLLLNLVWEIKLDTSTLEMFKLNISKCLSTSTTVENIEAMKKKWRILEKFLWISQYRFVYTMQSFWYETFDSVIYF